MFEGTRGREGGERVSGVCIQEVSGVADKNAPCVLVFWRGGGLYI
jgi:hypothetical protein